MDHIQTLNILVQCNNISIVLFNNVNEIGLIEIFECLRFIPAPSILYFSTFNFSNLVNALMS